MGNVKAYFQAARSEGNKAESVRYFTDVDSKNGHQKSFDIFRWVYNNYTTTLRNATEKQVEQLMEGPAFCSDYAKKFGHVPNSGESAAIAFAVLWSVNYLQKGVKSPVNFCYVAETGELDGDEEVKVLMGKEFNCIIPDYVTKDGERVFNVYVGTAGKVERLRVYNVGLDTCEIQLTSNKEG